MVNCLPNLDRCKASCCKLVTFQVPKNLVTPEMLEGSDITLLSMNQNMALLMVPRRCQALTEDNKCKFHGTSEKPKVCSGLTEETKNRFYITEGCILKEGEKDGTDGSFAMASKE